MIKRIYHPCYLWEDYQHGILKNGFKEKETEELTFKAKMLLTNPEEFYNTALMVINIWIHAAEQNLSNTSRNRRAWLGQASCCFKYNVPEYITKYAWRLMTLEEQNNANEVAEKIIKIWENRYAKKIFEAKCL